MPTGINLASRRLIRAATTGDIPVIRRIAQATWPVSYRDMISPEQIAYMLELMYSDASLRDQMVVRGHRFFIAEHDGDAIGFASCEHQHAERDCTRLHKLYVLPDIQASGTGKALLEAVAQAAQTAGDRTLDLTVNKRNRAIGFYSAQGFTIVADTVIDIGGGFVMDDHVMARHIA